MDEIPVPPTAIPSFCVSRRNGAELAGDPLGAGEDAVPGPGRDGLIVYRPLFRDAPGDMRPAAKTPPAGGQDGPR